MHEEWIDRLSDYVDDEVSGDERAAIESHLAGCRECSTALDEIRRVVERARASRPLPPHQDLWPGIADRIGAGDAGALQFRAREPRRFTFTLPQLAAAAVLIAVISSAVAWRLHPAGRPEGLHYDNRSADLQVRPDSSARSADADAVRAEPVSLADAQYDAAVADLERALARGRGRLDKATIAIVEDNLKIIDQAIAQARDALAGDPANSYLSGHLVEARRKKLDLLRRAAALTTETN